MTTAARPCTTDAAALLERAAVLEVAAQTLRARHEEILRHAERQWRDLLDDHHWRTKRTTGATDPRAYRMIYGASAGNDVRRHGPGVHEQGAPDTRASERGESDPLYVREIEDPRRRTTDARTGKRRDKVLAEYRDDYLTWARGHDRSIEAPPGMPQPAPAMLDELDLADDCEHRAGADRRLARVLTTDEDDWTVDPLERELAADELARAQEQGDGILARLEPLDLQGTTNDPNAVRVIGYARVSTDSQEDGASLDEQERQIRARAQAEGWRLIKMYREVGSAGSMSKRPLLREALASLEQRGGGARKPEAIVVAYLDRLTRSTMDAGTIFQRQRKHGWQIVALDLGIDTRTSAGELVAGVMIQVGQWQRRVIGERTKSGLAERKRQGVVLGRRRATDDPKRSPAERQRATQAIARLLELRATGMSYRRVAATLNDEGIAGLQGGRWHDRSVIKAVERYSTTEAAAA